MATSAKVVNGKKATAASKEKAATAAKSQKTQQGR